MSLEFGQRIWKKTSEKGSDDKSTTFIAGKGSVTFFSGVTN